MANYYYALAPWEWRSDIMGGSWNMPASCVGAIDLGPLPAQSQTGSDRAIGLFACTTQIDGTLNTTSGDLREIASTAAMQDAFQSLVGYRPSGDTLNDLLYDTLLNGDPQGNDLCKPLVPESGNELTVWLPRHSKIKSESFEWGRHRHTNRLRDLLRRDIQAIAKDDEETAAKVAGGLSQRYFGKWDDERGVDMIPPQMRANGFRAKKPRTSYSDSFSGTLAAWTQQSGTWTITSGKLRKTATGGSTQFIRYDSDVSSANHEVSLTNNGASSNNFCGPAARVNSSGGQTAYVAAPFGNVDYIVLFNPGQSNIATQVLTYSANWVYKIYPNGSTIKGYSNGVERNSVTNTSVSSGVRGGAHGYSINSDMDDWLIDDLIAAGGNPYYYYAQLG